MAKNPNAKGAHKKKLAEKVALRAEAKRAERSASSTGNNSSQHRGKGLAIPAKKMEQMPNDVLQSIVTHNQPGARLAQQVLDKRAKQAELARSRNPQNAQASAAA